MQYRVKGLFYTSKSQTCYILKSLQKKRYLSFIWLVIYFVQIITETHHLRKFRCRVSMTIAEIEIYNENSNAFENKFTFFLIPLTNLCNFIVKSVLLDFTARVVIQDVVTVLKMLCVTVIQVIVLESVKEIGRNPSVMVRNLWNSQDEKPVAPA